MPQPAIRLTDPRALRGYAHPLRMALLGLLRREGPLTATEAAARLGESVPGCSYHLRQLAKYHLAERAEGADARERPWRATAMATSWDAGSDDPGTRAAVDHLDASLLSHYMRRAQDFLAGRDREPADWRRVTGWGDAMVYLTAAELAELQRRIEAVLGEYDERLTDPAKRPAGSRPIGFIQLYVPSPTPAEGER